MTNIIIDTAVIILCIIIFFYITYLIFTILINKNIIK